MGKPSWIKTLGCQGGEAKREAPRGSRTSQMSSSQLDPGTHHARGPGVPAHYLSQTHWPLGCRSAHNPTARWPGWDSQYHLMQP